MRKTSKKSPERTNKLSRQDYVKFAAVIANHWETSDNKSRDFIAGQLHLLNAVSAFLKADNERFDEFRFFETISTNLMTRREVA